MFDDRMFAHSLCMWMSVAVAIITTITGRGGVVFARAHREGAGGTPFGHFNAQRSPCQQLGANHPALSPLQLTVTVLDVPCPLDVFDLLTDGLSDLGGCGQLVGWLFFVVIASGGYDIVTHA